jgi:hypothetical protein
MREFLSSNENFQPRKTFCGLRSTLGLLPFILSVLSAHAAFASAPALTRNVIEKMIRNEAPKLKSIRSWADDITRVFEMLDFELSPQNVCSVIAVTSQESSFAEDPLVPGLGRIAAKSAEDMIRDNKGASLLFSVLPAARDEFLARVRASKTEKDLDLAYRWLTQQILSVPLIRPALQISRHGNRISEFFEANNRVKTVGSMQVAVSFALQSEYGAETGEIDLEDIYKVRDYMYTRRGGLYYGTMRLLGYRAGYQDKIHLFADYNAGRYSSRNAAFQKAVSALAGGPLKLDGDLLLYDGATPSSQTSATEAMLRSVLGENGGVDVEQLRADLVKEKEFAFIETETYKRVRALYRSRLKEDPPSAIVPQLDLSSPKIKRRMTTADFARSVQRRFDKCLRIAPTERIQKAVTLHELTPKALEDRA